MFLGLFTRITQKTNFFRKTRQQSLANTSDLHCFIDSNEVSLEECDLEHSRTLEDEQEASIYNHDQPNQVNSDHTEYLDLSSSSNRSSINSQKNPIPDKSKALDGDSYVVTIIVRDGRIVQKVYMLQDGKKFIENL